jgi:acylpyruvate hydrolase
MAVASLLFRRALSTRTAASLRDASKIICIGRNYADHISELNNARPKQPFYFLKPPSSILLPGEGPILRPRGVDLHYEVELALVMGQRVKDFDAENEQGAIDAIECMPAVYPYRPDRHPLTPTTR